MSDDRFAMNGLLRHLARLKSRPTLWIFLALAVVFLETGRSRLFRDPGTFWHTEVGRRMLESGAVVREDPFSFTFQGQPWIAQSWLAECTMAAMRRGGGWDALLVVAVLLLAAVYAAIARRLFRAGLGALPALLALALAVAAGSPQFHVRPLLVSTAFFYATVALLTDVDNGRCRARRLGWLVPLCAVWANCHGGVLGGFGSIALVAAGWCVPGRLACPSPVRGARGRLAAAAVVVACGLALLVNPFGAGMLDGWRRILSLPLAGLIEEHAPLALGQPLTWSVAALAMVYVVTLIGTFPGRPRITWFLPLVWLALACERGRNAQLFAISAAVAWADMLPHSRVAAWLARRDMLSPLAGNGAAGPPAPRFHGFAAALAAGLVAVAPMAGAVPVADEARWARFDPARWPVELLPELERIQRERPPGAPIFNDMLFGGFLIEHGPRLRVFIDDRCELYGREFLLEYDRARRTDPARIDAWRAAYGFRDALVETGGSFDRYLQGRREWSLVGRTRAAALYRLAAEAETESLEIGRNSSSPRFDKPQT